MQTVTSQVPTLTSINPATQEAVGEVPITPAADIPSVIQAARAAGAQGATVYFARGMGIRERLGILGVSVEVERICRRQTAAGPSRRLIPVRDVESGIAAAPDRRIDEAVDGLTAGGLLMGLGMKLEVEAVAVFGKRDQAVVGLVGPQDCGDRRTGR